MKTTYEKLINYQTESQGGLARNDPTIKTKLGWAIFRLEPAVKTALKEYNLEREDIMITHAATEEKGGKRIVVKDLQGGYCFEPDEQKAAHRELAKLDNKEIEIKPYMATDLPLLTPRQLAAFDGFVLEMTEPLSEPTETVAVVQ